MSLTEGKNLFECRVCYSRYDQDDRKPKYLSCHHTVCFHCITKTMDYSFLRVRCPFCREWTEIKSLAVDSALRTNQDILGFMEVMDAKFHQGKEPTKALEDKWCCDCQQVAISVCKEKNHHAVAVSPVVLNDIQEALEQSRQSQANWEEAISQRDVLRSIATSIQVSVNKLKERIDTLVDENDRELLALRVSVEDVMQSVKTLDPLCFDLDFDEVVFQSNRDLSDAKKNLEKFNSLDDAIIQLTGTASVLNGCICWQDFTQIEDSETKETESNISLLDARRLLGYLLTLFPQKLPPNPSVYNNVSNDGHSPVRPSIAPPSAPPPSPPVSNSLTSPPELTIAAEDLPTVPTPVVLRPSLSHPSPSIHPPQPKPRRAFSVPLQPIMPPLGLIPGTSVIEEDTNTVYDSISPPDEPAEYTPTCLWNPAENVLAATRQNEPVYLYSGQGLNKITSLVAEGTNGNQTSQPSGKINHLAWNSRGTQLVTGSTDGWIQFWTAGGVGLLRQKQHNGEIMAMKWSPEGKFLATGGRDTYVKVWNVAGQNCIQSFLYHTSAVWDLDWHSPETFASCGVDGKMFFTHIRLVNRPKFTYAGHEGWVKCLRWDPESLLLASCSVDATVKIWTSLVPGFLQEYKNHKQSVNAVEWSPTGPGSQYPNANRYLASCSDDQTALILDVNRQAVVHKLEGKTKPSKMTCLSFSGDGKYLATGNATGVVEVWSVHNGKAVHSFPNFGTSITKISWNRNGTKLAIARHDKNVAIVEIRNKQ